MDIYDQNRQPTGRTVARSNAHMAEGEYLLFVLGIIQNLRGDYLIVQRSQNKSWAPLCWEVPGGGVSAKETSADAIVREMREELGLDVSGQLAEPFHSYESVDLARGDNYFVDMYRFVLDISKDDVVLQEEEALDCAFVAWDDICALASQGKFLHFERLQTALGYDVQEGARI